MTADISTTRRQFAAQIGGAAAGLTAMGWTPLIRGASANDAVRVGVPGTGVRGKYLIGNLPKTARVTAICDCATSRMADTLEPKSRFTGVLASFCERELGGVRHIRITGEYCPRATRCRHCRNPGPSQADAAAVSSEIAQAASLLSPLQIRCRELVISSVDIHSSI